MTFDNMIGPSPYDSDPDDDTSFETLYPIVLIVVNRMYTGTIGPADDDDIKQEVALKILKYRRTNAIDHPWAFIGWVVRNVINDMYRKYKPSLYQEFPRDESGDINESFLNLQDSDLEADPERLVIQKEGYEETSNRVADAITELDKRQQQATICTFKKRLDEWLHMAATLQEREIDTSLEWPDDPKEKQCLQASYSHAKRNIAHFIDEDISQYKRPRRRNSMGI